MKMDYILLIGLFVFYYPIMMSIMWISGGILFYLKYEFRKNELPPLSSFPAFSIVIPCHNEEKSIKKCIESVLNQTRPADQVRIRWGNIKFGG